MNEPKKLSEFDRFLIDITKGVSKGELGLHDDRALLMPRKALTEALMINRFQDVQNLFDNQLIVPIEEDDDGTPLYHAAICIDFLNFLEEVEKAGFPHILQQSIAETYQTLFWAPVSDMDYEINEFKKDKGREPSNIELAYLRVINDWAASNTIIQMENNILAGRPEELTGIKERAAKLKRANLREIKFGFAEDNIEKIIKEIWITPFRYFRGARIKTFIDIGSMTWTKNEENLLRKGHFDFALCNDKAHLCLVVEYQGTGHYGCTYEEEQKIRIRDNVKKSICDKAEMPILQLKSEYAFSQEHIRYLQTYLNIHKRYINSYQEVANLVREQINSKNKNLPGNSVNPTILLPIKARGELRE